MQAELISDSGSSGNYSQSFVDSGMHSGYYNSPTGGRFDQTSDTSECSSSGYSYSNSLSLENNTWDGSIFAGHSENSPWGTVAGSTMHVGTGSPLHNWFPSPNHKTQPKQTSTPKRKRKINKTQRVAANMRERRRMTHLNEAFENLKQKVPAFPHERKLSRIQTLKLAIEYISFMSDILYGSGPIRHIPMEHQQFEYPDENDEVLEDWEQECNPSNFGVITPGSIPPVPQLSQNGTGVPVVVQGAANTGQIITPIG